MREGQHQTDGEDRHRTGHHGHGHHRERQPPSQRKERIGQRHEVEQQGEAVGAARALEAREIGIEVVEPDHGHDPPEEGQHVAVAALAAPDQIVNHGDPGVETRQKEFHGPFDILRRAEVEQDGEHCRRCHDRDLPRPRGGIVTCDGIPENLHAIRLYGVCGAA